MNMSNLPHIQQLGSATEKPEKNEMMRQKRTRFIDSIMYIMTMLGIFWVPRNPVTSQGGRNFESYNICSRILNSSC